MVLTTENGKWYADNVYVTKDFVLEHIDEFANIVKMNRNYIEYALNNLDDVYCVSMKWSYKGVILFVIPVSDIEIECNGHKVEQIRLKDKLFLSVDGFWMLLASNNTYEYAGVYYKYLTVNIETIIAIDMCDTYMRVKTYSMSGRGFRIEYPTDLPELTKSEFRRAVLLS